MRFAARLVIMNDLGQILCVRLKKYPNFWCLPGGTLEDSEDYKAAAIRECIEELGVKPILANPVYVQQLFKDGLMMLDEIGFAVMNNANFYSLNIGATSHGAKELEEVKFIDIGSVHFLPANLKTILPSTQKELLAATCEVFSNQLETT